MIKAVIPNTDLHASSICLGAVPFGSTMDEKESFHFLDAFVDRGGNFLDTALNYADWCSDVKSASEKTLGKWLKQRKGREGIIVGTKGACPTAERFFRLEREDILSDLHRSLSHLQTDCIDLYWLHRDDPSRPVEEIVDVLNEQVQAGKIRYFGCSNWTLERLEEAQRYAAENGKQGFCANQMMWSPAQPNVDAIEDKTLVCMDEATARYHEASGLAAVPFSSQAGGFFSGRYRQGAIPPGKETIAALYGNDKNFARLGKVLEIARDTGKAPAVVALSYMFSHAYPVFPIIGSRTIEQLNESCEAGSFRLDSEMKRYLEAT